MNLVRIVIVDDHKIFAEALAALLEAQSSLKCKIMDVLHDGDMVMASISRTQPDLILLDLNLPGQDGLSLLPQIHKNNPDVKIIILTMYDEPKFIKESLQNGAEGYLLKSGGLDQLLKAIEEVMAGRSYITEGLKIFPKDPQTNGPGKFEDGYTIKNKLTKRELEILELISQARSNKEIAEILFISPQTVSVHRKNVMRKLNVSNTASLIKYAMDHNII